MKRVALAFLPGLIFGLLGYFVGRHAFKMHLLRDILDSLSAVDLLVLPVLILFVLAFHEMGHLLGGFSRGMKFLLFVAGPFQFTKTQSGIRFKWVFNLGTFGGLAAAMPDPDQPLAPQMKRLIAGGPLASMLLATTMLLLMYPLTGRWAAYAFIIGGFSTLIFIVTAFPFRAGGFMSDGMQYIEMMRGGKAVEERQTLTLLMGQSMAGIRPRELDRNAIERALRFDGDPLRQVVAHMYAYYSALDRGDHGVVDHEAAWLAEHVEQMPMGFRQSITLELSMHEAMRGNTVLAQAWMSKSKGGIVDGARRALAEAMLACADKDAQTARAWLAKSRQCIPRSYDAGSSLMTMDQIGEIEKTLA